MGASIPGGGNLGVSAGSRARQLTAHRRAFHEDLGSSAPAEWRGEIDQTIIPGAVSDEVVFFHKQTRTLILADTIMNFELDKIKQPYRLMARLFGVYAPRGGMPVDLRFALWPSRQQVKPVYEKILSWQPERIILSHGRCFDSNATSVLRRVFGWAL